MTKEKLLANLEKLRKLLPEKPKEYTPVYPKNIRDSLTMYLRQCTLGNMRMAAWRYENSKWPMPLYMDPEKIRLGRMNRHVLLSFTTKPFYYYTLVGMFKNKTKPSRPRPTLWSRTIHSMLDKSWIDYYDYLNVATLTEYKNMSSVDEVTLELFETNLDYIKRYMYTHVIFQDRMGILNDIFECYHRKNWYACITAMYPLLDAVVREYCGSIQFETDITTINKNFTKAGFSPWDIDNLKHGALYGKMIILQIAKKITAEESNKVCNEYSEKRKKELGFPGIALSSFLIFAAQYYKYVRKETRVNDDLNRHAIIHNANTAYGTRLNAVKLFTFLFLTLELEPVLKILFAEE